VYNGDKECRLFKVLARGDQDWRTTAGLVKASHLPQKDVEAICAKYVPLGIIQQHSKEPEKWRYWERATAKKAGGSISDDDKKRRIDEQMKATKP
jgi:hypothetical protein